MIVFNRAISLADLHIIIRRFWGFVIWILFK